MSWDDWSANNAPPIVEDEKWHVALAPGEVKVVSLEQLDDLYRLSIVDSETKVWQTGMSEWQPLRVIAGLDEAAAPEPKRTHPKPPSPRSAPPPPRPPSRAPTPQYAQPIGFATTQPAFIAPLPALAPLPVLNSVRPLVVPARPASRRGGGFGRFLIGVAVLAGIAVTVYRNGVLHDVASAQHFERAFGKLEAALGGPSFGTLRAVEQSTATAALTLQPMLNASLPATEATHPASAEPTAAPVAPAAAAIQPPVVSLESIKPESGAGARPKLEPATTHAEVAPKAPVSAPAKAVVEKAAPPPPKPVVNTANMTERERLNAAIGQAMSPLSPSTKGKAGSKSKASEYDPLNPKL